VKIKGYFIEKTMIYTSSNNQSLLGLIYKKDSIVSEINNSDNIKEKIEETSLEEDRIKTLESKIEENNEIISKLLRIIENNNLS
jgi:predicted transcriptional regulator